MCTQCLKLLHLIDIYLLHNLYLSMADIANPDLFVFICRIWIRLDISRFCEVVLVHYVVVAATVMRVLLFVLDVSMLRECEGDVNAGVWDGEV